MLKSSASDVWPLKNKSQYTLEAQPQKRLVLMTHLSSAEEHTSFLSKSTNLASPIGDEEVLSKDGKSIKVYGLRRFDSMPLAPGNVTVNNKNEMSNF